MPLQEGVTRGADLGPVSVHVAPGWVHSGDGISYVPAEHSAHIGPLTPFFSVARETADGWRTIDDVLGEHAATLIAEVDRARLLDISVTVVDELPASRVLLAHVIDGVDLTLEHWVVPLGRSLVLLTAQAPTLEFSRRHGDFQDFVAGVVLDG